MDGRLIAAVAAAILGFGQATAQPSGYQDLAGRKIKALSETEIDDLLAGRGAGMALPAELNRYPGPTHVLALANELRLSAGQVAETRGLVERMRAEAVPLGQALVAQEATLERLFDSGTADETSLRAVLDEASRLRGALRFTHLKYHLAMRRLLTPEQVAAYATARGYDTASVGDGHGTGAHH